MRITGILLTSLLICLAGPVLSQGTPELLFQPSPGITLTGVQQEAQDFNLKTSLPLFSFILNGTPFSSSDLQAVSESKQERRYKTGEMVITLKRLSNDPAEAQYEITFANHAASDTMTLENIVPFGTNSNHIYITGKGKHPLSRTHLFRPGHAPVNIIVPDNAWELGYAGISTEAGKGICALTRRRSSSKNNAWRRRFETILYPGGTATYHLWLEAYEGEWQEGLRRIFQENHLYDLEGRPFDETLYQREDLQWIRSAYAMHLMMAWDRDFYDPQSQTYQLKAFLEKGRQLYGGDDVIGIWPNWPMLGLDQRNQWDLFRDLPGGTEKLRELATHCRRKGTRFFISYNPWDESTRWEDHHAGMSDMIGAVTADGVVLDTEGKSSREHQAAADQVRSGVIMYSEGMAVPKDMPGIVAGRVHNALYFPPLLNLNKFIRPDFAIFRVAEIYKERIRREYALSFFNGYGTEINQFRPGRPDWVDEDYGFWGRTLRILRENTSNFNSKDYRPLIDTQRDSIYVNEWPLAEKTVFTVLSLIPEGCRGPLFRTDIREGHHLVDLWNHELIEPDTAGGQWVVPVDLEGFSADWLGTNNEGAVGAVAVLPKLLSIQVSGDYLTMNAPRGDEIRLWAGLPSYQKEPIVFSTKKRTIKLLKTLGPHEGKFVVQLFEKGELLDEQVFEIPPGTARMISEVKKTNAAATPPQGMASIPAGPFFMEVSFGDNFIPHPVHYPKDTLQIPSFYMDKHPVTNAQFATFLEKSSYQPSDTTNFLKHWKEGRVPAGRDDYPVIYVSYEDARAYARWAGKRLPTEIEWQYAAQTTDGRKWPWAKNARVKRERKVITETLTVSRLQVDSTLCNTGDGRRYPVGAYPEGANPYGLQDLVGCVWQLTNDLYDNGTNQFLILKGGSYFLPANSWWYVEGGPRELTYSQKLLRVSPGFERNATTGFRCVKDR